MLLTTKQKKKTPQDSAFLLTLPVELVYMIFDNLSNFTIICSLRQVCTRLNMIMDTYPRYHVSLCSIFNSSYIFSFQGRIKFIVDSIIAIIR